MDVALVHKGPQLLEQAGRILLGLVPATLQLIRGEIEGDVYKRQTQNSRIEAVSIQGLLGGNNKYLDG